MQRPPAAVVLVVAPEVRPSCFASFVSAASERTLPAAEPALPSTGYRRDLAPGDVHEHACHFVSPTSSIRQSASAVSLLTVASYPAEDTCALGRGRKDIYTQDYCAPIRAVSFHSSA